MGESGSGALTRRRAMVGGTGVVVGAAVLGAAGEAAYAKGQPLPPYGGTASLLPPDATQPVADQAQLVWRATTTAKALALTFDDGPTPGATPQVLAALKAAGVQATFFCLGSNVVSDGALHAVANGHELACHAYTHDDLARMDYAAVRDQLDRTCTAMQARYGARPRLFRPPYGHVGGSALVAAASLDLTTVLWSAQFREASFVGRPDDLLHDALSLVRPGSIFLGHDNGRSSYLESVRLLPRFLERLQRDGWTFHTVSGLLKSAAQESASQQTKTSSIS